MKYPTGEYRKLLCLYQQLQQPEPVIYSRSLREHHLLFLSNTPRLILYFTRQGKHYWLVNEHDCFGLKPFRHVAGEPGQFFTRPLKNFLSVKLHRVLTDNTRAIRLFCQAFMRDAGQVFDELVLRFNQQTHSTFMFHRSVSADSRLLPNRAYTGIMGFNPDECRVSLTLRRSGLGQVVLDINLRYTPLPFVKFEGVGQIEQHQIGCHLTDETQTRLKAELYRQIPDLVELFFRHS